MCKDGIRVVIADDEPITRMDLKELLSEEGYQVVGEAADGFDAVEACKQSRPDLVLMDIKMPLLDGLSAAKILFEENLADTVMMLTAYSEREFVDEAKHIGVAGYLVMTQEGMTEQDAYDYIRKLSQTKNLSMRRVSEIILLKSGG